MHMLATRPAARGAGWRADGKRQSSGRDKQKKQEERPAQRGAGAGGGAMIGGGAGELSVGETMGTWELVWQQRGGGRTGGEGGEGARASGRQGCGQRQRWVAAGAAITAAATAAARYRPQKVEKACAERGWGGGRRAEQEDRQGGLGRGGWYGRGPWGDFIREASQLRADGPFAHAGRLLPAAVLQHGLLHSCTAVDGRGAGRAGDPDPRPAALQPPAMLVTALGPTANGSTWRPARPPRPPRRRVVARLQLSAAQHRCLQSAAAMLRPRHRQPLRAVPHAAAASQRSPPPCRESPPITWQRPNSRARPRTLAGTQTKSPEQSRSWALGGTDAAAAARPSALRTGAVGHCTAV